MFLPFFRRTLALTLSTSLLAATPYPLLAETSKIDTSMPDWNLRDLQQQDPLLKEFAAMPWAPPKMGPYDASSKILDQDPYFMRSQAYKAGFASAETDATAYVVGKAGIQIQPPGARMALEIRQPLVPLFEVENFLFFQASDKNMFLSKYPGGDDYSEGLFFVDKRYIYTELQKSNGQRPVPVYFLPLEGGGWTGPIQHISVEPFTVIALKNNEGNSVTFDLQQITQLAQILHNNVIYATVMAMKHDPAAVQYMRQMAAGGAAGLPELPFVLPPRGSTSAYGLFFTGVNLDRPEDGIEKVTGRSSWNVSILPNAHADGLLSPDVLDRLLFIGEVTGAVGVLGILAQITTLKKRMLERRAFIESREDQIAKLEGKPVKDRSGVVYKTVRVLRETIDVFSHGLASLSSGIGVTAGFILEYGADKFNTGRNGWVRWALENTFLYSRKLAEYIGCNWQSFYLGVLILGGVDTAGVYMQLLWASPIFFPWVAGLFSSDLHSRISEQFSGANATNNNDVTSEVMRNFSGYFVSGAYQYSSSQRAALMEIVRPEVTKQMQREGKDPEGRDQKELTERIEERLELMLVERGLPSRKEFLFSSPSLLRAAAAMIGYRVDREELKTSVDFEADNGAHFVLETARWGVLSYVLKNALQAAIDLSKAHPDDARLKSAAAILKDTKDKYHVVWNALKNPSQIKTVLAEAKKVRQQMTLLSYEGDIVGGAVKYLDLWDEAKKNPEAATVAARIFRQSFFAATSGKQDYLKPTTADIEKYGAEAEKVAAERLKKGDPAVGYGESDVAIEKLEVIKEKVLAQQKKDQDAKWKPEKESWLSRMQKGKAHRKAMLVVQQRFGMDVPDLAALNFENSEQLTRGEKFLVDHPEAVAVYREAYRKALADELGLYPIEGSKLDGEIARLERMVEVETKVMERMQIDPHLRLGLETNNPIVIGAWIAQNPTLLQQVDARIEGDLKNDALVTEFRQYRNEKVDLTKRLEERKAERDLVNKVKDQAEKDIQENMENNSGWKQYHDQLDEVGQIRFLAHQYADAFLAKYVEATVSNSSTVSLTSPAQPGRFQKLRQTEFLKKDGFLAKIARTTLRVLESPMDATAYRPGIGNWLRRNIPWYQDAKTDIQQTFRVMWAYMTIGYFASYYIWQVKFGWPTAFFFLWTAGITTIVHYWLDRVMMNTGVRPMHDTWSKVKYSVLYTWLTYPSYIPFFFWKADFDAWWRAWIWNPIVQGGTTAIDACAHLLRAAGL